MPWLLAVAAIGLAYPYLLYPVLLSLVSGMRSRTLAATGRPMRVAVLVSAYNEEARIAEKITNFEASDYPSELIELWIGTDGSTDSTAQLIRSSASPRLHLVERPERSGKTSVLNDLAKRTNADVLVFTDVNAGFHPDAIQRMVDHFVDPRVGLVSGRTVIRAGDGNVEIEGAYYRLESWLKEREGACGWLAGADGAIYALRASLYRDLPPAFINDLAHPCEVVARGFEARLDPLAVSEEAAGSDAGREFDRQTRIAAQAAYLLAIEMGELRRHARWGMLWVLASHKWARWILGLWLIVAWAAITVMSHILGAAVIVALLILLAAWRAGIGSTDLPVYFLLIHLAYLNGLWQALRGERYVTWKPRAG